MSDPTPPLSAPTRRAVLGGAAAAPSIPLSPEPTDDELARRGRAWLDLDARARRLERHWARLETSAMTSNSGWYRLSDADRAATSLGAEMNRIDEELTDIFAKRASELVHIERLQARSSAGVLAKLAIASRLLEIDDGEAAHLVADALKCLARPANASLRATDAV